MDLNESIAVSNSDQNPKSGLSSLPSRSDLDATLSDLDHTAEVAECLRLQEELQNLVLKEAEEAEKALNGEESGKSEEDDEYEDNEYGNENEKDENGIESEKVFGGDFETTNERRRYLYPVRPDAEDCAYYMKTGMCKFGSLCKFNHPVRRKNQDKVKEREEPLERPGQTECKYYLRTGGCKYGKACRYNHTKAKPAVASILELNFLGLPIRPGEKECPYYMRNGSCKYGANCRFNHPDPTAVGGSDAPTVYGNGGSVPSLVTSQAAIAPSWSSPRTLKESAPSPFVPVMFSPTQGVPSPNPEWNSYQAPVYSPERSMHPPPAYVMNNITTETSVYSHQQQMVVDEFPERLGQPECSYFLKTGDCKFKSNCKYHHPKNRIMKPPPCALSDKGLPLRPGQNICTHYSRYGICKYGPACRYDHPVQSASSNMSGPEQSPFGNTQTDGARMAATETESDSTIQQPA